MKDSYDWFRGLVKERRRLDDAALDRVADGRVFTGRQGLDVKLVDELGLRKVAVYAKEDRLALHRFKADEAYQIGEGKGPVEAYLDYEGIVALAKEKGVDAKLPVRDWQLKGRLGDLSFLHLAAVTVLDAVGLKSLARRIENSSAMRAVETLNLDGLLALWHPPTGN